LGNALRDLGRLEEAEASYRQAISLKPDFAEAHSNLLFLQSSCAFDSALHLKEALTYANAISKKVSSRFAEWSCVKKPQRLRIGFVSGDLRNHPVGYFIESLLTQLNSSSVELFAYPTNLIEDELTTRIKPRFASWTPLFNKSDKAAAQLIHNDGVHILIDLSGHTANNRLPIFAWKPAPIQISWLGYWATTGVPEIDYVLGDPHVTPYDEANHFTEKIWQLPEIHLCLTEPNVTLEVKPLPALSTGTITFGCFNKLAKMTDEVVALRAQILKAVPGSKLFLKAKQLGVASGRDTVLERFSRHDITADRLILEGRSPRAEYLASYNRMDIALSPFPYGGVTTSAEGLWMGVPVLTKRGDRFLSHVGETIAHNAGLSDWIAADEDEYVAKAVAFSSDLKGLAKLRADLRGQLLSSPLFNSSRFASHFEKAVWSMWELWEEEKIAL
jgi:predicted O-linked N-acetylglucosamine transferase (SPINDLY family)